jgi:hypothetical protein
MWFVMLESAKDQVTRHPMITGATTN